MSNSSKTVAGKVKKAKGPILDLNTVLPVDSNEGVEGEEQPKGLTARREPKIRYSDGLGWSDDTQTWWIHVRCGKRTHTRDTGKRHKRDAESWLMNFRREQSLLDGTGYIPRLTVAEGLQLWVDNVVMEPMRSHPPGAGHIDHVVRTYKWWVLPTIGKLEVERLTKDDLASLVTAYRDAKGPRGDHNRGGVRNFIINLNIPLRWLHKTERISRLPRLPMIPAREKKVPVIIPTSEFEELLERYDRYVQHDVYAMIYLRLMGLLGLRTTHARSLQKSQFRNSLQQLDTKRTKNGNEYLLPVVQDIQDLLRLIPDMDKDEPLFPSPYTKGMRSGGWCLRAFQRAAREVGVTEKMAWHRLRATYASALVEMGVDVFQLMRLMGWETLAVAVYYVNVAQKRLADSQNQAADLLLRRRNP